MPKAPEPSSTCQKTTKSLPRISPKSYCYNAVPNRFLAFFQLLAQTAHVCFHEQKRVHTHLRQQDRTQRLTRRNRGDSDGGAITTLGLFHTFQKPCVAGCQNGVLCRCWALVGGTPEGHKEPAEQRCAYARRCSEASRPRWAA